MRFDAGSTTSSGRISNTPHKVLSIEFHARSTNTGLVYFGRSDVSATNGRELAAGEAAAVNFSDGPHQGSVPFNRFYVTIATGGDRIDWVVVTAES